MSNLKVIAVNWVVILLLTLTFGHLGMADSLGYDQVDVSLDDYRFQIPDATGGEIEGGVKERTGISITSGDAEGWVSYDVSGVEEVEADIYTGRFISNVEVKTGGYNGTTIANPTRGTHNFNVTGDSLLTFIITSDGASLVDINNGLERSNYVEEESSDNLVERELGDTGAFEVIASSISFIASGLVSLLITVINLILSSLAFAGQVATFAAEVGSMGLIGKVLQAYFGAVAAFTIYEIIP